MASTVEELSGTGSVEFHLWTPIEFVSIRAISDSPRTAGPAAEPERLTAPGSQARKAIAAIVAHGNDAGTGAEVLSPNERNERNERNEEFHIFALFDGRQPFWPPSKAHPSTPWCEFARALLSVARHEPWAHALCRMHHDRKIRNKHVLSVRLRSSRKQSNKDEYENARRDN